MHLRYFAPANLYSAQTKVSTIQPALLEFGLRLQIPLRELIAPQNEFPRAPMMELATTISSSKSSSRQNLYGPLLTVLTLQSAVNSGTVFDLNIAFNLFITAYPALSIIFNANNIQMKSPLRGSLWRLTAWLSYYSGLYGADLCLVLYRQVLRILESRNLYLRLPFCKKSVPGSLLVAPQPKERAGGIKTSGKCWNSGRQEPRKVISAGHTIGHLWGFYFL